MVFRYLLIPFSFIYYIFTAIRNVFYEFHIFRECSLDARVVSIGNITWGGTGKTPAVIFIARLLLEKGHKPVILIRGYGGDEQGLFPRLLPGIPVKIGKNRINTGRDAISGNAADTILLDDGFQHRRLKRDLDIVCIDAVSPFGNGCLIPAGSMRESLSGLKRADVFLLTKIDLAEGVNVLEERLKKINPDALIVKSVHKAGHFYKLSNEQLVDAGMLKGKSLVLVSGVGNPESFEKTISGLGLNFKKHFIFRDHHWYNKKDLEKIKDYCFKNNIEAIITTEKDAIKLKTYSLQLIAYSFLVLHIELRIIENEQRFRDRLFGIYSG